MQEVRINTGVVNLVESAVRFELWCKLLCIVSACQKTRENMRQFARRYAWTGNDASSFAFCLCTDRIGRPPGILVCCSWLLQNFKIEGQSVAAVNCIYSCGTF